MPSCTFFGHKDTPEKIEPILMSALEQLIKTHGVTMFYVGNNGAFDRIVRRALQEAKRIHKRIDYAVVLAYRPFKKSSSENDIDYSDTIYPHILEDTPLKYAIDRRNRWMIDKSSYVLTYVRHNIGGAAKFKEIAERKGLIVINLADVEEDQKVTHV